MDDAAVRTDFESFTREHWSALMSIGVAVSGSRVEAEDLVQTALTNAYARWTRIRRTDALAYLRRSIVNANVSRWRRHRGGELSVAYLPDAHGADDDTDGVDERHALLPLLRTLPPRQRAVLVLRYLCDMSDADVAETLDISLGTVRSQAFRGLAALRAQAGHDSGSDAASLPENEEVTR